MKTKSFDCVEMKRVAAEEIYEEIKGMSREQELAYWRAIEQKMKSIRAQSQSDTSISSSSDRHSLKG